MLLLSVTQYVSVQKAGLDVAVINVGLCGQNAITVNEERNVKRKAKQPVVYLIGSLSNNSILKIANRLRAEGWDCFEDWMSPGPTTDFEWMKYEKARGRSYKEALAGWHAKEVFEFDKRHLDRADAAVLVLPAGRSGHLELGYTIGKGKPGYILLNGPQKKFDIMYGFATAVCEDFNELTKELKIALHR